MQTAPNIRLLLEFCDSRNSLSLKIHITYCLGCICRALEEKKRAMAVAEEQRRRKALEERRKAQHEATARFKSAICRVKSNPRAKHKPMDNIESMLVCH